jgi:uncharacterized membrane protein
LTGNALKIGLAASLAANVFLVGAIGGAFLFAAQKSPASHPPATPPGRACAADAPRGPFRQMMCDQAPVVRPIQQDSFEAKRQAMTLMAAPTYDRAAIGALFDRSRADDMKARAHVENAILDFAATLPADRRERLVEAMRNNARRRIQMRREGAAGG